MRGFLEALVDLLVLLCSDFITAHAAATIPPSCNSSCWDRPLPSIHEDTKSLNAAKMASPVPTFPPRRVSMLRSGVFLQGTLILVNKTCRLLPGPCVIAAVASSSNNSSCMGGCIMMVRSLPLLDAGFYGRWI